MGQRGTGRTTRMLEEAIRRQKAGENVLVVGANRHHALQMQQQMHETLQGVPPVVTWLGSQDFAYKYRGTDYKVLFDHYALEEWARNYFERQLKSDTNATDTDHLLFQDLVG